MQSGSARITHGQEKEMSIFDISMLISCPLVPRLNKKDRKLMQKQMAASETASSNHSCASVVNASEVSGAAQVHSTEFRKTPVHSQGSSCNKSRPVVVK